MIKINITQKIIELYKETLIISLLPRRYFHLFKLKRSGQDLAKNKLCVFYKELIKNKKLMLYNKPLKLKDLLLADFHTLSQIKNENESITFTQEEKNIASSLYDDFRKKWAYTLVKELKVSVCSYCNRNYITNFGKNSTTTQLDHFFDKNDYPYFAISLYNLVPSCSTCNQRKSSKKKNIFYPYLESFNDSAKFKYDGIKSRKELSSQNLDFFDEERVNFHLEAIKDDDKVKEHIEVFNLKPLYNEHKDVIAELLQKRVIYSDSYINELMSLYEGTLFKNREDLLRLIACGYITDEEISKRPLSKLIKDISEELKLI